jgi:membrane-associated phospholipid phosphatase
MLQSLGAWFVSLMQLFSLLGDETFYLLILPLVYWSFDDRLGLHIGLMLMLSVSLNAILKVTFHTPRPFWVLTDFTAQRLESSFGIPSGHAQNAVAVWGVIAAYLAKPWAWAVAVVLIFFIGLSRVVLGVHFPIDVLSGWIVGAILLYLYWSLYPAIFAWYRGRERSTQLVVSLAISLVILLAGAAVTLFASQSFPVPESWETLAAAAGLEEPLEPYTLETLLTATGVLFGLIAGYLMLQSQGGFLVKGQLLQHLARYVLGVLGVFIFWFGLGQVFPDGENLVSYGLRYFRYALIGAWISWLAPYLFIRLKLARRKASQPTTG